ncbi:DUF3592 domain-containing protein [filamentous cyanobacterium LEGE 11480]|uniref:DUF3592 domain-containing protein n=1 Tax=Romeriopsis navalis LEGE 11480 TaxID=2777977 RepID=A0A928Z3E8_9CYAN|nr:DUF3592 domain-containing protein [Romeriopsis navalis]MBE9029957.1 DUF3592 domain-containing protein [Romeriopsis navalis LEGE 11480]
MYPFIACLSTGIICVIFGMKHCAQAIASRNWPRTLGTITRSHLETFRSGPNFPRYALYLRYTYCVNGRDYIGHRVRFRPFWNVRDRRYMETFTQRYPKGSSVEIFYAPSQPKVAILEPGFDWSVTLLFLMGLVFLWAAYMLHLQR